MAKKIIKGIGSVFPMSGIGIVSSLLSKKKEAAPAPPPPAPVMPTMDAEAVRRDRKRAIAAQLARGGRASTILTDTSNSQTLGG